MHRRWRCGSPGICLLLLGCAHLDPSAPEMRCARSHDLQAWADAVDRAREAAGGLVELRAIALAAARASTCAIDQGGAIWCWGQVDRHLWAVAQLLARYTRLAR